MANVLHGRGQRGDVEEILNGLEITSDRFGTVQMTDNVKTFFTVVRSIFGDTDKKELMFRVDTLRALAKLFWDHTDFWDPRNTQKLLVRAPAINKLAGIRLTVMLDSLERSNATADLYRQFVRRMDSGTRTVKLTQRTER